MTLQSTRHRSAASVYRRVRSESLAQQSTPQELILLVFESLIDRLVRCQGSLQAEAYEDYDVENLKCMQLIQYGLRDSISFELGGEVAVGLDHTYATWMMVLEFLHKSRSAERLSGLIVAVSEVRDAWRVSFGMDLRPG